MSERDGFDALGGADKVTAPPPADESDDDRDGDATPGVDGVDESR